MQQGFCLKSRSTVLSFQSFYGYQDHFRHQAKPQSGGLSGLFMVIYIRVWRTRGSHDGKGEQNVNISLRLGRLSLCFLWFETFALVRNYCFSSNIWKNVGKSHSELAVICVISVVQYIVKYIFMLFHKYHSVCHVNQDGGRKWQVSSFFLYKTSIHFY